MDYDGFDKKDCDILLKDRLKAERKRLDTALEALGLLCQPVLPPKDDLAHIHYFCGNSEQPEDLKTREPQRHALYKAIVELIRAFANLADEMELAGYDAKQQATIGV